MGDKKAGFPIRIKSGSATVRIYDRSDAFPYYRVAHYVGSQRHMKPFTRLADARRQAHQIAEQISAGEAPTRSLWAKSDFKLMCHGLRHLFSEQLVGRTCPVKPVAASQVQFVHE